MFKLVYDLFYDNLTTYKILNFLNPASLFPVTQPKTMLAEGCKYLYIRIFTAVLVTEHYNQPKYALREDLPYSIHWHELLQCYQKE